MTNESIKEQLSLAFVKAIAANAGIIMKEYKVDYGLDGGFCDVDIYEDSEGHKRYYETGFGIDFQLKSTTNIRLERGFLVYDLEAKNYNDLVRNNVGTPRILILYVMPENRDEWLQTNKDETVLKKCAWWFSLKGCDPTSNSTSKRIRIPERNLLTSNKLKELIKRVKEGEEL